VGAYQPGSDPRIDQAIEKNASILEFLQQDMGEAIDISRSLSELQSLLGIVPEE
jgi:flagellum-specific ATP synthase